MPLSPFNGLLLVDKPADCTSHDVVNRARKLLGMKSVGHSGTLDPLASGLMVLLLGEGTKLSDYILNENKRYWVRMKFGVSSDTLDRTGEILEEKQVDLDPTVVRAAIAAFLSATLNGRFPQFSAVKIAGRKLYEYARNKKPVKAPIRTMSFFDLDKIEVGPDWATAEESAAQKGLIFVLGSIKSAVPWALRSGSRSTSQIALRAVLPLTKRWSLKNSNLRNKSKIRKRLMDG